MKKASLLLKQFTVHSLLIILPVIVITFISNYIILSYSEAEISKAGLEKLEVADRITKLLSQTITNDAVKMSLNPRLNDLYGSEDIEVMMDNINNLYMLLDFQKVLSDIIRTNSLYSSMYVYLDNSNYIITSNGVFKKEDFRDKEWIDSYIKNKKTREPFSWISPRPIDSTGENYVLSYIFPLTPYTTNMRGVVAINLNERSLSGLINSSQYSDIDQSDISVIDFQGKVISSINKKSLLKDVTDKTYVSRILKDTSSKGFFTDDIDGKKVLVTFLKEDVSEWIYVGVFSLDTLSNKVNSLREMIIYISIALLILGIATSFVISRKIYNPVKKLVQEIKARKGLDITSVDNEVTLLSRTFETLIREEDQLFNRIEKSQKYLRENYITCLLRGASPSIDEQTQLFPYSNFLCVLISIDRYKDFVASFSYEQQFYLKSLILSMSEETLRTSFSCSGIALEGDRIVLLVNFNEEGAEQVLPVLKQHFSVIQKEAEKVIETTITVCLSNAYNDIHKIRTAYIKAQNLLKYRFMLGYGQIIENADRPTSSSKYFYPFNLEKQILNNVDTGSKSSLLGSLNNLIDEIKENKELTFDNVMLILNQLLGNTVKYLLNLNLSVSKVFGNDFNIYSQLAELETLDDAGLFLTNIYLQIIEYTQKLKEYDKSHIAKIMQYIQENYKKDIAINNLADHVGLSYSHVRKIFNDETGENIVNYINNMRIEEAQRLLRQSGMNINEIALSLGYNNKQSFNRFFKKYVGVNPGEYRNIKSI